MSAQATFWAQKQRPSGGPTAQLVLRELANIYNDHDNGCRPKLATLAERCMMSERHVRRILASLERDGLIERKTRYAKRGGYQLANNYELKLEKPSPDTDVRPCKPSPDTEVRPRT